MTSTTAESTGVRGTRRAAFPPGSDPVVAEAGAVRLLWCARRLRGDLTITEAAQRVGLNRDELARIERGETKQIQFKTVAKLIAGYGCSVTDLFEVEVAGADDEPTPLSSVLAALASGVVADRPAGRRTVQRSGDLDVIGEDEGAMFAPSPEVETRRRRAPVGTVRR